jgi:hypothetical protein
MLLSSATVEELDALDSFSSGQIACRGELGLLMEAARTSGQQALFEKLCFNAKIASRTFRMMQRIGKDGLGYDNLEREFLASVAACAEKMRSLNAAIPEADRQSFEQGYLTKSSKALGHFLELCRDLSWYKNWRIDHHGTP